MRRTILMVVFSFFLIASAAPYKSQHVAYAGHTVAGNYCECGAPGCFCDPGEEQTGGRAAPSQPVEDKPDPQPSKGSPELLGVVVLIAIFRIWLLSR